MLWPLKVSGIDRTVSQGFQNAVALECYRD